MAAEPRSYTGTYLKPLLDNAVRVEAVPVKGRKKRASASSLREPEAAE